MHSRTRAIALACVVAASRLGAQDGIDHIDVHGFGGWSYGRTSKNNVYLGGLPEGDNRASQFALNLGASSGDAFHVSAQTSLAEDDNGTHIGLDYAFAEYKSSDRLRFRIGQVKQPFGLYTELYNVGTVRPFLSLPQGVYGPVGFAGQSYKGVGLTGSQMLGAWRAEYDVYGGGQNLLKQHVVELYYHDEPLDDGADPIELLSTRNVVGSRLIMRTPIAGLSFGGSAYTGILDEEAANRRTVVSGQLEYLSDRWSVRSEIASQHQVGDEDATGWYGEAAYRFAERWQAGAQYNRLTNTFYGVDASAAPSLQHHNEGVVGLNYWFTPSLVVKLEMHRVDGNRFALPNPAELAEIIHEGELAKKTSLIRFGGQFSF
ncbi:MAG: hypothetical protein JO180_12445 [Gemmatirosa sp.]|nr:hypothetical protein [Gemmatirosa sp.]